MRGVRQHGRYMSIHEFDFRYSWTSSICQSLELGFSSIREREKEEVWFDGLWQLEHIECLFGIAFVSAQTYILGTVQDINTIRKNSGKSSIDKIKYYAEDTNPLPCGTSRITLINAIANYYKHHDEWDIWPTNSTTKILSTVGITDTTEFPCYKAAITLWGEQECGKLGHLLFLISEWRQYILNQYR
jgi:hypothetical protein